MSYPKRDSGPLYQQIKGYLDTMISHNLYNRDFRLPSETKIAQKFNSSRVPVIQALKALEQEGKIYRIQGKGTFIKNSSASSEPIQLQICMLLPSLRSRFVDEIVKGAQQFFNSRQAQLFLAVTDDLPQREAELIETVQKLQLHGLLFFPIVHNVYSDAILDLAIKKYPTVFIARNMPRLNISSVFCDPYNQVYHAVEYLIGQGHEHIGYIGEDTESTLFYDKRLKWYREAMERYLPAGRAMKKEINFFDSKAENNVYREIAAFLENDRELTAIITTSLALLPIYQYLLAHNVPGNRYTIMVFDDTENMETLAYQKLVLIDQSPFKIGYLAAEQLYRQITENEPPRNINVPEQFTEVHPAAAPISVSFCQPETPAEEHNISD